MKNKGSERKRGKKSVRRPRLLVYYAARSALAKRRESLGARLDLGR